MSKFFVHPSSIVDEGVVIGEGTKIWHFTHISAKAVIGENCVIGQNVFIGKGVIIGKGVKIQNNVSVYEGVKIEDDVFIGPSVVFTNVINPRAFINRKEEFLTSVIKKGASIGANSTIVCGNSVGEFALVGAGSVVTKEVKKFSLCYGNPIKQKGWVDRFANKLILVNVGDKKQIENYLYSLKENGDVEEHDRS